MCSPAQKKANIRWKRDNFEHCRKLNNKHSKAYNERNVELLIDKRRAVYQFKKISQIFRNILLE